MTHQILVINPGSTSTKVALFQDKSALFEESVNHSAADLNSFRRIPDQLSYRAGLVSEILDRRKVDRKSLSAVVGRGGMLPGIHPGGYLVGEEMKDCLTRDKISQHASNLGALLAASVADPLKIPAFIYDATGADEYEEISRVTGVPGLRLVTLCHVLNSKAVCRKTAEAHGSRYEDQNYIVAHLGGGITISAHKHGRIVDSLRDDAGPFAPERCGKLPMLYALDLAFSGKYSPEELYGLVRGNGGIQAYLGTKDLRDVEEFMAGDDSKSRLARQLFEAMAYQIAKGIGELSPVFRGQLDAILLTGGMAFSRELIRQISEQVSFLAPVRAIPGEFEMEALALGALRILSGEETAAEFHR